MSATGLLDLLKIYHESGCPGNGRRGNLLAKGQGIKVDGTVSPSEVALWYPCHPRYVTVAASIDQR